MLFLTITNSRKVHKVEIWRIIMSRVTHDWKPDNLLSYHPLALRKRLFIRDALRYQFLMQKRRKWDCPRCLLTHPDRLDFVDSCVLVNSYVYGIITVWSRWQASRLFHHIPQTCDDFSLVIYDTDWWLCWFVWLRLRLSLIGTDLLIIILVRGVGKMTKNSNYVASQHIFAVSLAFRNYLSTIWTFLQSFD